MANPTEDPAKVERMSRSTGLANRGSAIRLPGATASRSVASYEAMLEAEEEREDRFSFNTLLDMIENELTAFGSKPGSRSGGVSIFSDGRAQGA